MARSIFKYSALGLAALSLVAIVASMMVQRFSDGPVEPMQGGPFKTGEIVEEPVEDWSFAADKRVEFELVGFGTSRVAGFIMHEGEAYMTCDLGFIWNRLEPGNQKRVLNLIYIFKRWHTDALEDGRARLRIDGRIYNANFVKVEDPGVNQALRAKLEERARGYLGGTLPPHGLAGYALAARRHELVAASGGQQR